MFKPEIQLKESGEGFKRILAEIKAAVGKDVLVGVPPNGPPRKEGKINNATLMYIHSNGSPANNLLPRPVIEIALDVEKDTIGAMLGHALKAGLDKKDQHKKLENTGKFAVRAIKQTFGTTLLEPLKMSTKLRKAKLKVKRAKTIGPDNLRVKLSLKETQLNWAVGGNGEPLIGYPKHDNSLKNSISYEVRG